MKKDKQNLYKRQSDIIKALAHPVRVAIVDFLSGGEQCVCDIAEFVESERSNVSKHLAIMTSLGVLDSRKEGLKVIYSIKTPCLLDFLSCITNCVKENVKQQQKLLRAM